MGLLSGAAEAQSVSQIKLELPDAPVAAVDSSSAGFNFPDFEAAQKQHVSHTASARAIASPYDKLVAPNEQAPTLSAKDKLVMGAKDSITPFSAVSWLASAGWSHLTDGPPNYGTDSGAFGQRLGAAAIHGISEDIFTTSIMSNVFREDPRYYKLGRSHSIKQRIIYAAMRPLITRTDSGRTTPNLALLTGYLAGSALTNAYYPDKNHGFGETMQIYGSSIGGSALGFGVSEFLSDALEIVHLKKRE
ncbi:MAG TPA: hypothetical protein VFE38_08115 [Edaphobacter sp.]|nr:hypothetical protein [Edaphobacter sp.]